MRQLVRSISIALAVLILSVWAIVPVEKKLRLGKDLSGGISLVYAVQLKPGDDPALVITRIIEVLKERVDPQGLSEITIARQGRDRIEITMPLPTARVKALKRAYEAELARLDAAAIKPDEFERLMRLPPEAIDEAIKPLAGGDPTRTRLLTEAAQAQRQAAAARADYEAAKAAGAADDALAAKVDAAAEAEDKYEQARASVFRATVAADEVRRALELSGSERTILDERSKPVQVDSPRAAALKRIRKDHPGSEGMLDSVVAAFEKYASERRVLDDPSDLKRLLSGAGVLEFRITIPPGVHPEEDRLKRELAERGPRNVRSTDARWFKINRLENWYNDTRQRRAIESDPVGYFADRRYTAAEYQGEVYILGWDTRGSRLTKAEGQWAVENAYQATDQLGRPSIAFRMDAPGAIKLDDLTKNHVSSQMAVLLDDQVYTAPTLNSRIGKSGEISGEFTAEEIQYIVRVLSAGSLQAKLSPDPISESVLGPELGADNLRYGFNSAVIAFGLVAVFMIFYYFSSGAIAVFALAFNLLLVLAAMSLGHAAFTLPGIAGIVLTFGQAIDSNVLIYERMREEFLRGHDMKTAVRLGFSRAFSSIVDGNVANLLICAVLYQFGTQEIKGFAITLGIGVVTTLFTALFISRLIFTIFVDHLGWRKASQLPMAVPFVQKLLSPHVDWMRWRWVNLGALAVFLAIGGVLWFQRGDKLLDTEFLGGTQVELWFKADETTGQRITMKRQEVQDRVKAIAGAGDRTDPVKVLEQAEVLPVNPLPDGVTSDRFKIKIGHTDEKAVLSAILHSFADVVESRGALDFRGSTEKDWQRAPVYKIVGRTLGENVNNPAYRDDVSAYLGGAAVMLEGIKPPATKQSLVSRLEQLRQRPEFSDTLGRTREVRVLEGDDQQAATAVILVRDDAVNLFQSEDRWTLEVAAREWQLVRDALTQASQLANVQTFSPTIAATFKANAVVSIALSLLLLTIYVWVRFGAGRWALAATVPLFADVIGIVGLIALAQLLYENPSTNRFAVALGLLPFKIDLNQIAALLTITGYSLNDKIIIMDRIRENKGKLPYASYKVINDSINQTLSRTIITAGTTLFSTVILYLFGGEAVRGFAYAFTLGVFIGTYTSIVSSPLVWSRASDASITRPPTKSEPLAVPA